ncbi:MAG: N-acetylmuramoyl-L-alanine amidase [Chitinophagales bacterium]|nr:N-acetylmuramoyl-L-alanine amidase [Chitinophagales bacterium]MDW8417862.1 N-acetylmuramoyl-L-alanine amidase [Chitinophagales bacterium]
MKNLYFFLALAPLFVFAGHETDNPYREFFEAAYREYPSVPRGILEAVAFNATRMHHILPEEQSESCIGLPKVYGVMGLTLDGKGYFHNNLVSVSELSGFSADKIIDDPATCIMAYAKAYSMIQKQKNINTTDIAAQIPVLTELSELPDLGDLHTNFALQSHLYSVLKIMDDDALRVRFNIPKHKIDFSAIFGENNLRILSAPYLIVTENEIRTRDGSTFFVPKPIEGDSRSADYGPALWNPAASCNYGTGRSATISSVAIHTVEGSYAGCISWFKNCNAGVSAHYVVRSSDGQITQMVLESNTAYHVAGHNSYTIGIEHEGYVNQSGWYTTALYNASANLVKDICSDYSIDPATCYNGASCACQQTLSTSIKIKGHQHYAITNGKTDPGQYWNWSTFYNLVNNISACGTPSGLSASGVTSSSATLNWSSVSGAVSYNIQYKTTTSTTWITTTSTTNTKTISGLSHSTTYQFKVQAVCSGNTGAYSAEAIFTTAAPPPTTIQVGSGTSPYSAHPFSTVWMDERTQYIITKSELQAAGWNPSQPYLKSLAINITTASTQTMNGFTVTIAHTSATNFNNSTSFITGSNTTTVYSGTFTAATGWRTIQFSTPFYYNGTSNLLINICFNNSTYTTNSAVQAFSYPDNVALYHRADLASGSVCNITTGTQSYYRPNFRLTFHTTANKTDETDMPESELTEWNVYPNPMGNTVSLSGSLTHDTHIRVRFNDLSGRIITERRLYAPAGNFNSEMDVSVLPVGAYIITVGNENRLLYKKLVLKN